MYYQPEKVRRTMVGSNPQPSHETERISTSMLFPGQFKQISKSTNVPNHSPIPVFGISQGLSTSTPSSSIGNYPNRNKKYESNTFKSPNISDCFSPMKNIGNSLTKAPYKSRHDSLGTSSSNTLAVSEIKKGLAEQLTGDMFLDNQVGREKMKGTIPRHFIGTVEYVIQWYKVINQKIDPCSTFQVIGWLECVKQGKYSSQKLIFIRGEGGSVLQCIYYEMDIPMPTIEKGQLISCTGRMIGAIKLHAYDIQTLKEEDRIGSHRAIFLSQRIIDEKYI